KFCAPEVLPALSVAMMLKAVVTASVGVPLRTPVLGFRVSHWGRPCADHMNGPVDVPSTADNAVVYALPAIPTGSEFVVIISIELAASTPSMSSAQEPVR